MTILYLGYWNLDDPLTHSTVFPNLKILSSFSWIDRIVFVNMEREFRENQQLPFSDDKIIYKPFVSGKGKPVLMEKINDFIQGPVFMRNLIIQYQVDAIIARGALAGGLAYLVWRKTKIPFYVESFEPHAQYMVQSNVWSRYDPRTIIEEWLERLQIRHASGLMPVANTYTRELVCTGIDEQRIRTVPCLVDTDRFQYSKESRNSIRNQLGIKPDDISGVYAGRYGGLYLEEDAFRLYKLAFEFFKTSFHLILLTPSGYQNWVNKQLQRFELPASQTHILSVIHDDVPDYLSASDFAFATYKPGKAMAYLSPVKIGEYWANGLPVILTEGVGDEDQLIRENAHAGVLFQPATMEKNRNMIFRAIQALMANGRENNELTKLAQQHRNPQMTREAYAYFLKP